MRAEVVRIAGRAVVRVLGGEAVGVLVHVERADQHRARRFEPRDQHGVVAWRPALASIFEPASVVTPATSKRFFTAKGTPASGGQRSPRARRA